MIEKNSAFDLEIAVNNVIFSPKNILVTQCGGRTRLNRRRKRRIYMRRSIFFFIRLKNIYAYIFSITELGTPSKSLELWHWLFLPLVEFHDQLMIMMIRRKKNNEIGIEYSQLEFR